MSQEIRKFVVRFNLANPLHQKAWSFLQTMDREKFKSTTNLTAVAITEYLKCITDTAVKYVADIFNALNRYEYNPKLMHLYIIGGGGCLIKNFGVYEKDKVTIIDDICAAAKGYEYLALATLRKRG